MLGGAIILLAVGGIALAILKPGNLADETKPTRAAASTTSITTAPTTTAPAGNTSTEGDNATVGAPTTSAGGSSITATTTGSAGASATTTTAPASGASGLSQAGASKADANGEIAKTGADSMLGPGLALVVMALLAHQARRRARFA